MANTGLETPEAEGEKVQIVNFETLYTGLREIEVTPQLQDMLVIHEGGVNCQIPLFKSLDFYSEDDCDPIYQKTQAKLNKFTLLFSDVSKKSRRSNSYFPHDGLRGTIFKIKKCIEDDKNYIFISDLGAIYTVGKSDFKTHGFLAQSLKLLSMPPKTSGAESLTNISNDNGRITYHLNGVPEGTLQGSCFTYLRTSQDLDVVYIGDGSCIYQSKLKKQTDSVSNKATISHEDSDAIDIGLGEIKKLTLDPRQNLFFIVSENEEGKSDLHVLDHKKLFSEEGPIVNKIKTINGVTDIIMLEDGDFLLSKSDGTTDFINTNLNLLHSSDESGSFKMKKIEIKKGKNQTVQDVLDSIGGLSISLDTAEVSNEGSEDEKKIIELIWGSTIEINGTSKTLKELFDDANSEQDIEIVRKAFFQIIKEKDALTSVSDLLKKIEREINNKKKRIVLDSIYSELDGIYEELKQASDYSSLFTLKEKLESIQKRRRSIQVGSMDKGVVDKDKELKELIEVVDERIKDYHESHKDELEDGIEKNLEIIKETLDDIENAIDISSIYTSIIYKTTEEMISRLDKEGQEKFKKKLKDLRQNRLNKIKEKTNKAKREKEDLIERQKREVEEYIKQIKDIIEEVDDIDIIEQIKESDPLVQKIKGLLAELPSTDAQTLDLKLDKIFGERIFALRLRGEETKGVVQNLDTYGIDTILYYDEDGSEHVEWEIEGKEKPDGKIGLVVKLMNGETHEYDKSLSLKPEYAGIRMKQKKKDGEKGEMERKKIKFDMNEDEFYEYQNLLYEWKHGGKRQEYYGLLKELRRLPKTGKDGIISDEKQKLLKKIEKMREHYGDIIYTEHLVSRLIRQQKLNPRSKVPPFDPDFIVLDEEKDILKTLSTRLVDQKHNSGIEILEGGPGLGKTVMCEFLASVTNREIVRVQCSKMDPSDMFFSPTLKKGETSREPADWIKLMQKPGTIVLFDEIDKLNDQCFERLHSLFDRGRSVYDPQLGKVKANPDCLFLGTRNSYDRLSNPILSRGRILQINYPSELNEAFKISKYSDSSVLKRMSYEEFEMLYDKYVNLGESAPRNVNEKKIYDLVININHLLNVFTKLRKTYDGGDSGDEEPFAFELSYRDARQIFVDYNTSGNFKSAMEKVLVPKARGAVMDPLDKKTQEDLVRRIINSEM